MTTVGHTLTGLSIAVLSLPPGRSYRWYALTGACFIAFANVPDFPLPGWGHGSYAVSQSIFVTILLAGIFVSLFRSLGPRTGVGGLVILAWSAAWLSHMVLDSMYAQGNGIAIVWPISDAHLAMPVPWFETLQLPARSENNIRVFWIETIAYGAMLVSCIGLRWVWSFRRQWTI